MTNTVKRDKLFYGQYRYRAISYVQNAYMLRYHCSLEEFDSYLRVAPERRQNAHTLRQLLEYKFNSSGAVMYRIEHNRFYAYSNNLPLLEQLCQIIEFVHIDQAQCTSNDNQLYRKNPAHQYRSYLNERLLNTDEQKELAQWFQRYPSVKPSRALRKWLSETDFPTRRSWYHRDRLRRDFYFDHDDQSIITVFNLCFVGLYRTTVEVMPSTLA